MIFTIDKRGDHLCLLSTLTYIKSDWINYFVSADRSTPRLWGSRPKNYELQHWQCLDSNPRGQHAHETLLVHTICSVELLIRQKQQLFRKFLKSEVPKYAWFLPAVMAHFKTQALNLEQCWRKEKNFLTDFSWLIFKAIREIGQQDVVEGHMDQ